MPPSPPHSCSPTPPPPPRFPPSSTAPWSTFGPILNPLLEHKLFLGFPVSPTRCLGTHSAQERQKSFPQPSALDQALLALCFPSSHTSPQSSLRCHTPAKHPATEAVTESPKSLSTTVPSANTQGTPREPGPGGQPRVGAGEPGQM